MTPVCSIYPPISRKILLSILSDYETVEYIRHKNSEVKLSRLRENFKKLSEVLIKSSIGESLENNPKYIKTISKYQYYCLSSVKVHINKKHLVYAAHELYNYINNKEYDNDRQITADEFVTISYITYSLMDAINEELLNIPKFKNESPTIQQQAFISTNISRNNLIKILTDYNNLEGVVDRYKMFEELVKNLESLYRISVISNSSESMIANLTNTQYAYIKDSIDSINLGDLNTSINSFLEFLKNSTQENSQYLSSMEFFAFEKFLESFKRQLRNILYMQTLKD